MLKIKLLIAVCIVGSMLVVGGCNNLKSNSLRSLFLEKVVFYGNRGGIFVVSSITDFEWERMYFINSDSGIGDEQFGAIVCGEGIVVPSHTYRICFMKGRAIVRYFDIRYDEPFNLWVYHCADWEMENCGPNFSTPETARYRVIRSAAEMRAYYEYHLECVGNVKNQK